MSWMNAPDQGIDNEIEQQKKRTEERKHKIYRYRMQEHETRELILLDDQMISVFEHIIKSPNGDWRETRQETCTNDPSCPFCQAGLDKYWRMVGTVLDTTGYTKKDGTPVKNQRRLLVLRADVAKKLQETLSPIKGSLRGLRVKFIRGENDASTGSSFSLCMKPQEDGSLRPIQYDLEKLRTNPQMKEVEFDAVNYEIALRPKSLEEATRAYSASLTFPKSDFSGSSQGAVDSSSASFEEFEPAPGSAAGDFSSSSQPEQAQSAQAQSAHQQPSTQQAAQQAGSQPNFHAGNNPPAAAHAPQNFSQDDDVPF